jgi:hypothetical protein
MAIVLGENTFVTLEDAETYFAGRLNSDKWVSASDGDREKALIMATLQINSFDFISEKQDELQALNFPREVCGIYQIPAGIKHGTCEQALYLLSGGDKYKNFQRSNVKSVSMGKESVSFGDATPDLLSFEARIFIGGWIQKGYNFAVAVNPTVYNNGAFYNE